MSALAWSAMSVEEYASFERSQGERVVETNGFWWRQVRPFFFRPLLPFHECAPGSMHAPARTLLGGYQVAVPPDAEANSHLSMLLFRQPQTYSVDGLPRTKRQQVLHAAREFTVRLLDDVGEFKEQGYPVYLSFVERTGYEYRSDRRQKANFNLWAESVLRVPKNMVFGAYRDGQLQGVSISRLVEDTIVYSTMFSSAEALARNVNSLMLHALREAASATPEVRQIFISIASLSGRTSVEEFFFVRGCELVHLPALLWLNPLARLYLERRMPRQYAGLVGDPGPGEDTTTESSGS